MDAFIFVLDVMFITIITIALGLIIYYGINIIKYKPAKDQINMKNYKYAILIPARNESHVIRNLLESIVNQEYKLDSKDIYIIIEDESDPTIEIVKEYNMSYYIRGDIEGKRRKGYALDECIKDILSKGLKYDAFFIFDADNVLDHKFIYYMNESFNNGYDIAIGYRNSTNWNYNSISVCSGLTFTMINNFGNIERLRKDYNVVISGTGYYIKGSIIEELGGFPFYSLTEDYELSLFSILKKYKTTYNLDAEYFDEQPTTLKVSNKQRKRWVKGYFEARKKYSKKIIEESKNDKVNHKAKSFGVWPLFILIIQLLLYFVTHIVLGITAYYDGLDYFWYFLRVIGVIAFSYTILVIFTLILIILEQKRAKFKFKTIIKALMFNPIFLLMYVYIVLSSFGKEEVKWEEIQHCGR